MNGNRLVGGIAIVEVVAFEDARDRELAKETQQVLKFEVKQPLGVVDERRLLGVEHLERLVDIRLGVMLDLLGSQLRARRVATRWIADESCAIADDECDLMTEVLELAQLAQRNGMADMDIGCRRVNAKLDVQRLVALELLEQSALGHDAINT